MYFIHQKVFSISLRNVVDQQQTLKRFSNQFQPKYAEVGTEPIAEGPKKELCKGDENTF